jgi:hypothetical protein
MMLSTEDIMDIDMLMELTGLLFAGLFTLATIASLLWYAGAVVYMAAQWVMAPLPQSHQ